MVSGFEATLAVSTTVISDRRTAPGLDSSGETAAGASKDTAGSFRWHGRVFPPARPSSSILRLRDFALTAARFAPRQQCSTPSAAAAASSVRLPARFSRFPWLLHRVHRPRDTNIHLLRAA